MKPLFFAIVLCLLLATAARAQRAIFLVRHAEKVDESRDPPLSEAGQARARALAALLKDAGIRAIYVSEYRRTRQTAEPLARKLGLSPVTVAAADREGLLRSLRVDHRDDVVLVVGHGDTLPPLLKALGSPQEIGIARGDYDNLFLLVPRAGAAPTLLRLHF